MPPGDLRKIFEQWRPDNSPAFDPTPLPGRKPPDYAEPDEFLANCVKNAASIPGPPVN
jgi:hypothetical protein